MNNLNKFLIRELIRNVFNAFPVFTENLQFKNKQNNKNESRDDYTIFIVHQLNLVYNENKILFLSTFLNDLVNFFFFRTFSSFCRRW